MEGEPNLLIDSNLIQGNQDGIVLLHSDGKIQHNKIVENDRSGIYSVSETIASVLNNTVENNQRNGIDIKDPSSLKLENNTIQGNKFQIRLDKNIKKKWEHYKSVNTITGESDLPQGFQCSIF